MRPTIVAIGAGLAFGLGVSALGTAAGAVTSNPSVSSAAASAPADGLAWCGFKEKAGSRVRCGYSSESDCKQAVGEPGAICILDPYLTENRGGTSSAIG
jgi:hypothetical protein